MNAKSVAAQRKRRSLPRAPFLIAIMAAAVSAGALRVELPKLAERQVETAIANHEKAEKKDVEARKNADREAFEAYREATADIDIRWMDALSLADASPRIALATPIESLQKIYRELSDVKVKNKCFQDVKEKHLDSMRHRISGFVHFMAGNKELAASDLAIATESIFKTADAIGICKRAFEK